MPGELKLEPCPFCGGEPKVCKDDYDTGDGQFPEGGRSWVVCGCSALFKWPTLAEAVVAWNTRAMLSASPVPEKEGGAATALDGISIGPGEEAMIASCYENMVDDDDAATQAHRDYEAIVTPLRPSLHAAMAQPAPERGGPTDTGATVDGGATLSEAAATKLLANYQRALKRLIACGSSAVMKTQERHDAAYDALLSALTALSPPSPTVGVSKLAAELAAMLKLLRDDYPETSFRAQIDALTTKADAILCRIGFGIPGASSTASAAMGPCPSAPPASPCSQEGDQ